MTVAVWPTWNVFFVAVCTMACEHCGIALSYETRDPDECGHGSGYNCCNCARSADVYNEEQYVQYACAHCRRRITAGTHAFRGPGAGSGGDGGQRYRRDSQNFGTHRELHQQVDDLAAEIVAEAERRRDRMLNQAQEDADRIRAEAALVLEQALAAADTNALGRGNGSSIVAPGAGGAGAGAGLRVVFYGEVVSKTEDFKAQNSGKSFYGDFIL